METLIAIVVTILILAVLVELPIILLTAEQKDDFKKYGFKNETYENFCKRFYSHHV